MRNKGLFQKKQKEAASAIMEAMKTDNEERIQQAWEDFQQSIIDSVESVNQEFEMSNRDEAVLLSRGVKQLTSGEQKYWEAFIDANKSKDFKQAIANIDVAFPETIFEDVFRELRQAHPLLEKITFQNVAMVTKWIMSDHSTNKAIWGEINDEITKEISGSIKTVDIALGKLSAFILVPKDMLELGPRFVHQYVIEMLMEAVYLGIEYGIVSGRGVKGEPIGADRDISEGVSVSTTDGYPRKTPVKLKDFTPASYGEVLADLATTEKGNLRVVDSVLLICNQKEYFAKIMPATTVLTAAGTYQTSVFPHPTEVVVSNAMNDGEALLLISQDYFFGIGGPKNGTITFDDSVKFLEDVRAYAIKMHGNGRAYDNTVAILLDISELSPLYITVKNPEVAVG